MGLEAALGLVERGFDATVLEKGRVGESLRRWGPTTRFFSPLGMNLTTRAKKNLGPALPDERTLLSGPEMAERVLEPLAASAPLRGRVRTGVRVMAVGRTRLTRGEMAGHPLRAERAFRLLVESADGVEEVLEAEVVLDASGVYDIPAAVGLGGVPAPGERTLGPRLLRTLGALDGSLDRLGGRDVLLVGHGHSAANALA